LNVANLDGDSLKLGDAFKKPFIVLALLRHFGCVLCRKSAAELNAIKPLLDQLNIGLVAIGSGTPLMANDFKRNFKYEGDLYCDKERAVYKALGCNRGLKYVISGKVLDAVKNANKQGYPVGTVQGDSLQLGGVFFHFQKTRNLVPTFGRVCG